MFELRSARLDPAVCHQCKRNGVLDIAHRNTRLVITGHHVSAGKPFEQADVVDTMQAVPAHVPGPFVRTLLFRRVFDLERKTLILVANNAALEIAFFAGVAAHRIAVAVANVDRQRALVLITQVIIENGSLRRILALERLRPTAAPCHFDRRRCKYVHGLVCLFVLRLAQCRQVVKYPEGPALCRSNQVALANRQVGNGYWRQVKFQ